MKGLQKQAGRSKPTGRKLQFQVLSEAWKASGLTTVKESIQRGGSSGSEQVLRNQARTVGKGQRRVQPGGNVILLISLKSNAFPLIHKECMQWDEKGRVKRIIAGARKGGYSEATSPSSQANSDPLTMFSSPSLTA